MSARNQWLLLIWPLTGTLVGFVVRELTVQQYERVWRKNQGVMIVDELSFYARLLQASPLATEQLIALGNQSADTQLTLAPVEQVTLTPVQQGGGSDASSTGRPQVDWVSEPGGFRRVRAVRKIMLSSEIPHWLFLSKRVPSIDQDAYGWVVWIMPIGFLVGSIYAWRQDLHAKRLARYLRSLQWLRTQSQSQFARDEMMELFPKNHLDAGVNRELIALVESFQSRFTDIQIDAEQSQTVLSAMPVGILAFTPQLRLAFANRAGIDMLDLSDPVRHDARLIELIRNPQVVELVVESQKAAQTMDCELERAVDQTVLRLRAYPLQLEPSGSSSLADSPMLLIVTDETRLRQLENARRDFTANVSHELKTPLAAIKAYAETLLMGAMDDPDAKERFVRRIGEQAARLDNLIRDLLQLTKIQSLPERLSLTSMPVCEIIRTCVEEHQPIAQGRNIAVKNHAVNDSVRVLADYEAMRTTLSNLLSNAIRYSKPGGQVDVRMVARSGTVEVSVSDNGIGIPEADLDRIFERFYRVDKARSQDAGGTGLGLSIVKYFVQAMGGSITVRSHLGVGSEFTIRLEQDMATSAGAIAGGIVSN